MSVIDMIKFKLKEVFWIRKTVEVPGASPPGTHQDPSLDPMGGSQHPPAVFLKLISSGYVTAKICSILNHHYWAKEKEIWLLQRVFIFAIVRRFWDASD